MKKRVGSEQDARQKLREKRAVLTLLQNQTLVDLLKAVDKKFTRQMRNATTPADREAAWHKLHGLDALYVEMQARIDRGTSQEKLDQSVSARSESGAARGGSHGP